MKIVNNTLIRVAPKDIHKGTLIIPDNVTSIGVNAFESCDALTAITIPDGVTSIGAYAFWGCRKLTNIAIPNSVKNIGLSAFAHCRALTSVTIPDGVTNIGERAFLDCTGLERITIPDSVKSIGEYAFSDCAGLTSVTIPDSVTYISEGMFYGCHNLTNITIPDSVTKIHNYTFVNCEKLTNIHIPNSVTYIGYEVFANCDGLVSKPANYKAFCYDKHQLRCRNQNFHINQQGWTKGKIKLCENGIHFCTNLFDVFNYYYGSYGTEFVIALCDVSDEQDETGAAEAIYCDSKRCARWVRPTHILTKEELIALLNNPIKGGEK